MEGDEKLIRYNELYPPEKTSSNRFLKPDGRMEHNSKYELYMTDEIEKEFYSNIVSKCEILSFDNFIKKLKDRKNLEKTFFYRQKYVHEDLFVPELQLSCYCEKIINPDISFFQCKDCKDFIHNECYLKSETKKCPHCGILIEVAQKTEKSMTNTNTVSNIQELRSNLLHNKRLREEESYFERQRSLMADGGVQNEEVKKDLDESKFKFANLNEDKNKYLTNLIERLTKTNSMINYNCTPEEKLRKNFRDQFCYSLLYGIEEIKENLIETDKVKNSQLSNAILTENTSIKLCSSISVAIETAMWLQNGEQPSKNYKKKFQTLYYNILDNRNTELRFSILNGDVTPSELVKMSSEELAPTSLKSRRTEQQNKYFKEQVLMKGEAKIIAKTHKGESILVVDKGENGSEVPEPIVNNNILSLNKEEKKQEENLSDKASWVYESEGETTKKHSSISNNNIIDKSNKQSTNKLSRNESGLSLNNNVTSLNGNASKHSSSQNLNGYKENSDPRYKYLTKEQRDFLILLDEYSVVKYIIK